MSGYAAGLGLIGWVLLGPREAPETPISPAEITLPTFNAPLPIAESLTAYEEIIERPLFQAGRRAATEAPTVDTVAVDAISAAVDSRLDGFRLAAVFSGSGNRSALVELPNGDSLTFREGDRLDNWKVLEIRDDKLVLDHRGQQKTLQVHDFAYLSEPSIAARDRALTERARRANRREARNERRTPQRPRQPRRDEEREDNN